MRHPFFDPGAPDVLETRRPLSEAAPLPRRFYVEEEVFRREQELIFSRLWLCLDRERELAGPGHFVTREIGQDSILVARGEDDGCRAFFNVCRHRGARLVSDERGSDCRNFQCPYHAWTYGLDGRLLGAPLMAEAGGFDPSQAGLVELRLDRWNGFLFVNLSDSGPAVAESLEDLPDLSPYRLAELTTCARQSYEVAANWKLLVENYSECYHCGLVHPQLHRISHYLSGGEQRTGRSFTGGPMRLNDGFDTMSMSGTTDRPSITGLKPEEERLVHYYAVYPNLLISLHRDYVLTHTLWPLSPSSTRIECEWLFEAETAAAPDFDPGDAVEFWDLTNRQDWEICERCQLGVGSSGYRPLGYQAGEGCVHAFDNWYLDRVLAPT